MRCSGDAVVIRGRGEGMQIAVVGLGYVGLVTATCLARLGQTVTGLEIDKGKLEALKRGEAHYYEPHLQGELAAQQAEGRLTFTDDASEALAAPDVVLICVGTPSSAGGEADLSAVMSVIDTLARHLRERCVIALRSTVPMGTTRSSEALLNQRLADRQFPDRVSILANPEFLRTGRAIEDFLHPSRVIVGRTDIATDDEVELLATLYRPLDAPILVVDAESAELTKNAANAYLAMRLSFVNELAGLCEAGGASIDNVIGGLASDPRIGGDYLRPGIGYGGSCLPKDVRSLISMGRSRGLELSLPIAVDSINAAQPERAADRLAEALDGLADRRIALLGLAFKPGTDDIRDSPALALAEVLAQRGAEIVASDPKAADLVARRFDWIEICDDPFEAAARADAVVLATEWPEYVTLDYRRLAERMRDRVLLDARNALDPGQIAGAGLTYLGIGRPSVTATRSD
jgi:UDPglucose 6-dehydrogenase